MAVYSCILTPSQGSGGTEAVTKQTGIGAGASGAEIALGSNQIFAVWGTQQINVKFGATGLSAATSTDFGIPANTILTFDTGTAYKSVRVFNNGGSAADIYVLLLNRS